MLQSIEFLGIHLCGVGRYPRRRVERTETSRGTRQKIGPAYLSSLISSLAFKTDGL